MLCVANVPPHPELLLSNSYFLLTIFSPWMISVWAFGCCYLNFCLCLKSDSPIKEFASFRQILNKMDLSLNTNLMLVSLRAHTLKSRPAG